MARVLVVSDENICKELASWLVTHNHSVEITHTFNEALIWLDAEVFDLVCLDVSFVGLPLAVSCSEARARSSDARFMILSNSSDIDDKEICFDTGADAYITKPFDIREVGARARALLRRPPVTYQSQVLQFGDIRIDTGTATATRAGRVLKLYPKEYLLLEQLVRFPNVVFSPEFIVGKIWNSKNNSGSNGLRTCICRLRAELGDGDGVSIIENIHGVGYRMNPLAFSAETSDTACGSNAAGSGDESTVVPVHFATNIVI